MLSPAFPWRIIPANLYNCEKRGVGFFDMSGISGFGDFAAGLSGIAG
jgi:hypothetical protein